MLGVVMSPCRHDVIVHGLKKCDEHFEIVLLDNVDSAQDEDLRRGNVVQQSRRLEYP